MVIRSALSNPLQGGQPATRLQLAQRVQCPALDRALWRALAHDAPRLSAMARGVSADATVDAQEVFRENDRRPVLDGACLFGAKRPAQRHDPDSRTIQSTPGSGARAGFDGAKKRKGSKVHIAVDTLGHLLALHVTPAHEQDRGQVGKLAEAVQALTGESVEISFADQGDTGDKAEQAAAAHGIELMVVEHTEAKRGFVLLARRWVVERSIGWAARLRRLARDYERLAQTLAGFHYLAFACLMLRKFIDLCQSS